MRKVFVVGIIVLFINMSVVSSSEYKLEDAQVHIGLPEIIDLSEGLLSNGSNAYTIIGNYPNCSGVFKFKLDNLNNLTCVCKDVAGYGSIAWISSRIIIFSDIKGNVYEINLETCEFTSLGSTGTGELLSLAYDPSSETLYGISAKNLYKINVKNGNATLIGSMGNSGLMITIDCDLFGKMYGIEIDFIAIYLYSINTSTGKATKIGNLGLSANYNARLLYDKDYDDLYFCFFNYSSWLYDLHGPGYHDTFQIDEAIFDLTMSFTSQTQPPDPPIIDGPKNGKIELEYEYNFSLSDIDNNPMYLRLDWGNGTSGPWLGPYAPDTTVKLNHTWYQRGTFTIRAQSKDSYNAESLWSEFIVTMQRTRETNNSLFLWFLERYPILQKLLGL